MFIRFPHIVITALVLHAPPLVADEADPRFEITPYAAYRMGGSFDEEDGTGRVDLNDSSAEGLLFNIAANPNGQYELMYARQRTDADTSGFFPNDPTIDMDAEYFHVGGTYLLDGDSTRPFIALTLGITQFDPELPDSGSESFFSASFDGAGACLIQVDATTLTQWEARAGFVFRF